MSSQFHDMLMSRIQQDNVPTYIVRFSHNDEEWYFFDLKMDKFPHPVLWTRNSDHAFGFSSEEEAEDFISDFIFPREVQILRVVWK